MFSYKFLDKKKNMYSETLYMGKTILPETSNDIIKTIAIEPKEQLVSFLEAQNMLKISPGILERKVREGEYEVVDVPSGEVYLKLGDIQKDIEFMPTYEGLFNETNDVGSSSGNMLERISGLEEKVDELTKMIESFSYLLKNVITKL